MRLGVIATFAGPIVPVMSPLGGVSFRLIENHWDVSSSGMEFDDALFSATLQELVFADAFQTLYEPLLSDGLRVGDTRFVPRGFSAMGDYLVVELGARPREHAPDPAVEPPARQSRSSLLDPQDPSLR